MKKALLQLKKPVLLIGAFALCVFLPSHFAQADAAETVVSTVLTGTGGIIGVVVAPLALFLLKITSLINFIAGTFLNSVIKYTVVDMAANYSGITAIASTWTVMRDIANMAFIFVLLYASIRKILGQEDNVNRLIVNMVIAALLINFSLFFTKIIIDASNLIALTFYQSLAPGSATNDVMSSGLSNSLMQPLHLQSLWNIGKVNLSDFKTLATIGIMGSLLTLIATFIFVAVALLFVIRYVVLILVLIMSPVFFLASILPSAMGSVKKLWVSALTGQALFAPIYMLLTWITIKVFSSMPITSSAQLNNLSEALAGSVSASSTQGGIQYQAGSLNVFLNFAIVIAFLIISIVVAKSMSDSSGKGMSKITGKAFGFAGGATVGMAGMLGRGTIGRIGQKSASDPNLIRDAAEKKGWGGARARFNLYTAQKAASGTFDARNATIPTSVIGDLTRGTVGRTAVGKKMGLDEVQVPSIPLGAPAFNAAGAGKGATNGFKENKDVKDKKDRDEAKAGAEALRKNAAKIAMSDGIEAAKTPATSRTPAQHAAIAEMIKATKGMTDKEIEGVKASTLKIDEVAEELSTRQLEKIQSTDNLTQPEKDEIVSKHFKKVNEALDAVAAGKATKDQENTIKNLSSKEIEMLPTDSFDPKNIGGAREQALLKTLNQGQIDELLKGNKLVSSEKQAIKDARSAPLTNAFKAGKFSGSPDSAVEIMRKMRPEDIVKLDSALLANPGILDLYSPALLNKMAARSEFTEAKAMAVRSAIISAGPGAAGSNQEKAFNWLKGDGLNIF